MAGVFAKVLRPVYHEPFAPEKVDSIRHALGIDVFPCATLKVFLGLEAEAVFHAGFEHFSRLLAKFRVLLVVWLEKPLPHCLHCL